MWRKGWIPDGGDRPTTLCNACGILRAREQPRRVFFLEPKRKHTND